MINLAALPPLRISQLAQMAKSPAHARYAIDHDTKSTRAMNLGTLAHAFMLGKTMPYVYSGGARRGKDFEAYKATVPEGEEIFLETELTEAREVARAVMNHDEAAGLMLGTREETLTWEIAGRPCRGTPDIYNTATRVVVDLKTTNDASPRRFQYTARDLAYVPKLAWYFDGLAKVGKRMERAFIVAVETKPPYAIAVYQLTDAAIEFGRKVYMSWFNQFRVHEDSNHWPGYHGDTLDAPSEDFSLAIEGEEVAFG